MKKALLPLSLILLSVQAQALTLIHAGQIIDGRSDTPMHQATLVLDANLIQAIEPGYRAAAEGDTVIDWRDGTLMPGFIDMHTHQTFRGGEGAYLEPYTLNPADVALRGVLYGQKTMNAGFTTVRDLGDMGNASVALRNAINKGWVQGPRIYTAGTSIATTGGHADKTNGRNLELVGDPGPKEGVINGAAEAYKAVRQRYKEGADLIKITATGGVLSVAKSGENPQFTDEELKAIVAAARDYGFKVAVHAHGKEGIRRAILAGVNTIEHGTYMDKDLFSLMKKHNVALVPTLMAGEYVTEKAKIDGFFPELVRPKAAEIGPKIQTTFAAAYKAGVRIAFGTDAGVFEHGGNAREFSLMVAAGMPPMKAIQSATSVAAEVLGEPKIGILEPGRFADVVGVRGNPLEDIQLLERVSLVIKDGKVVKIPRGEQAD
ncbi:metal-dependent hydrolase family protein [Shewanella sedimentimangrovi]|uniref:Amidohydrolase family protein n=1 Tax=Shewanella sedimentimangrovi TaxID=2814293 RepID=A0ABX7R1L4_9GAMM|nr:amidohydrolase family protein [Shewanella sedimentimangrovi]QSX37369.1 amidohydrolase family protein [Shewanella sedimentimangrovi]